jgi:acyl-CoA reductase-like NAD-dependent aldehyde dehydrogenase
VQVARVEWHPRGVLGAIVPWNYPFHNILNPVSAAVFSGNAIIVKVRKCHYRHDSMMIPL